MVVVSDEAGEVNAEDKYMYLFRLKNDHLLDNLGICCTDTPGFDGGRGRRLGRREIERREVRFLKPRGAVYPVVRRRGPTTAGGSFHPLHGQSAVKHTKSLIKDYNWTILF